MKAQHVPLQKLAAFFASGIDHLIVSASYEERAFGVWRELHRRTRLNRFVCFNENHSAYLNEAVNRFQNVGFDAELVRLDSDEPIQTFAALNQMFDRIVRHRGGRIVVDVTGFTREALAMLIYLAQHRLSSRTALQAVYHRAKGYGHSAAGGWLSQGVREVRNILGYPGTMQWGRPTNLVLLPGVEFERARYIIDAIKPKRISLGFVERGGESVTEFDEHVERFARRLKYLYAGLACSPFAFSPGDPFATKQSLLKIANELDENVICACLNAKPAMVGTCLAAIESPRIQLVYAQPICYNISEYSVPSGEVLVFDVPLRNYNPEVISSDVGQLGVASELVHS